jgi:protease-4
MRDFLKYTFATLLGLLIFLGLSIGGLVSLFILLAAIDQGPQVKDKSILTFDLSTKITDAKQAATSLNDVLTADDTTTLTLREVVNALDEAAQDPKIVALYLFGNNEGDGGAGFATLKEVRDALQRFRQAGKKIIAYDVDWREKEYYLGSIADTIVQNPSGSFELNGLNSEGMFYADALKKFGVGIQVTRVGKYKSAVEPLLLNKRSPENRAQTEALLGDLWNEYVSATSQARKLDAKQIQTIADQQGILTAETARDRKLVDKLAYQDEVITDLKQLGTPDDETKSFRQVSLKNYASLAATKIANKQSGKDKVAVVYAEGDIVNGQGERGSVGGDRIARQLRQLRQDEDVKAVVLRVNSPGGSATASDVIQREMILTRKAKPVVVSMGSLAASGGYWISTFSDRIFAEPNTITGSIGVFGIQPNLQALANNNGITWDTVKTGRLADMSTLSRPKTPEELAIAQKQVDEIYDDFLTKVAESRKLSKSAVGEIAQGRVWSGRKAKELRLVDELGGLQAAIQDAAKRAKLSDSWAVEEYPKPRSFEERLLKQFIGDQSFFRLTPSPNPLTQQIQKLQADLEVLQRMNDPRGIYARLPFNLRID